MRRWQFRTHQFLKWKDNYKWTEQNENMCACITSISRTKRTETTVITSARAKYVCSECKQHSALWVRTTFLSGSQCKNLLFSLSPGRCFWDLVVTFIYSFLALLSPNDTGGLSVTLTVLGPSVPPEALCPLALMLQSDDFSFLSEISLLNNSVGI